MDSKNKYSLWVVLVKRESDSFAVGAFDDIERAMDFANEEIDSDNPDFWELEEVTMEFFPLKKPDTEFENARH